MKEKMFAQLVELMLKNIRMTKLLMKWMKRIRAISQFTDKEERVSEGLES